jgi:hypothetical protein
VLYLIEQGALRGDIDGWLGYFLAAITEVARSAVGCAEALIDVRERRLGGKARGRPVRAAPSCARQGETARSRSAAISGPLRARL